MRVLVLTNLFPNPFQPNRAPFNRQQFRALAAEHEVEVIAPISWVDELVARRKGAAALPRNRRVVCEGLRVTHPRYLYSPRVLRSWYGHFFRHSVRTAFNRACADFRPDVVLGSWAYPDGWAAVELAKRAGLPVVVKVHGCDILCGGAGLDSDPARRRRTAEVLRRADGVVAVSQHMADEVIALGVAPEKARVVYSGIDSHLFYPGPMEDSRARLGLERGVPMILFVGNLVPVKGIEVLVRACAALAQTGLNFRACLIGEGPLKGQLARQIHESGLDGRVELLGSRPHRQLGDWFRAASVFALPSFSEGVPSVLLEAAACGTRFVASRVGGIPEVAREAHGRLVQPGDPTALAGAIGEVLALGTGPNPNPAPARSWTESGAELGRFLSDVVAGRAPRSAPRQTVALSS
jgi:glycosyltransferase involved in cell wall biosynthesis